MENGSDGFENAWKVDTEFKRWLQKSMENQSKIKAINGFKNRWKLDGTLSDGFKNRQTIDGKLKRWLQ